MKITLACLSLTGLMLVACNNTKEDEDKQLKDELFNEAKQDSLFEFGKTVGYEIKGTITNNDSTSHYTAAMKGNVIYMHCEEGSGGGWNYMVATLSDDGSSYCATPYKNDLSMFGEPIYRDGSVFKSFFHSSIEIFLEASKPAIYENSKYVGDDMILGLNVYKFEYSSIWGGVVNNITTYVEGEYGLTLKYVNKYVEGEKVNQTIEKNVTSIKKGDDVIIPEFNKA